MTNREEIQRDLLLGALDCGGSDLNKLLEIIEKGVNKKFTLNGEEVYLLESNWPDEVWEQAKSAYGETSINALIGTTFEQIRGVIGQNIGDYNAIDCIDTELNAMCSSLMFNKERFLEANLDYSLDYHSDYNEAIKDIADEIEAIINEF